MPRGGHRGFFLATPKDKFKSRWKRFYKRVYRPRSGGNDVDRPGHAEWLQPPDYVPSPWRLRIQHDSSKELMNYHWRTYRQTFNQFMRPAMLCKSPAAVDTVLRALDAGRSGGAESGFGRIETAPWHRDSKDDVHDQQHPEQVPKHIFNVLQAQAGRSSSSSATSTLEDGDLRRNNFFEEHLMTAAVGGSYPIEADGKRSNTCVPESFPVQRLAELLEEKEIVWMYGQNKPRARTARKQFGEEAKRDRGRFPAIDEHATLIDDLDNKEILRLAHSTKSRRQPKWKEIVYEEKKGHRSYLRRKQVLTDEVKARMGVIRQTLESA